MIFASMEVPCENSSGSIFFLLTSVRKILCDMSGRVKCFVMWRVWKLCHFQSSIISIYFMCVFVFFVFCSVSFDFCLRCRKKDVLQLLRIIIQIFVRFVVVHCGCGKQVPAFCIENNSSDQTQEEICWMMTSIVKVADSEHRVKCALN